jgi:hypothetical protein
MAQFGKIPLREARLKTFSGRNADIVNEYASYIQSLAPDESGTLSLETGEKAVTVRRRLTQAAKALDTKLIIRLSGDTLYLWKGTTGEEHPTGRQEEPAQSQVEPGQRSSPR